MSTKKIVFFGLLFLLMVCIAGCSPAEVSEKQIQSDVAASAPDWDTDAGIDHFTIVRRTPKKEEKTEKVYVKIDGKTDLLYLSRYYTLSYFYANGEGWMLSDIEAADEDLWETRPLAGPDASLAKQALMNTCLYVNDDTWEITEETIREIKIDTTDTLLDNQQATMDCTVILENDFVTVTGTAYIECQFDPECVTNEEKRSVSKNGWYVIAYSLSDDYICQFQSEKAPICTTEDALASLQNNRFLFHDSSYYDSQYVWLKKENIRELTVSPPVPAQKGTTGVFHGTFTYDTPVATFSVKYTLHQSYNPEDAVWQNDDDIEFESECSGVNLPAKWSGTYNHGTMGVDLTFTSIQKNGDLEAVYSFYPMPGNTSGKSGSYKMTGSYNPATLEIDLRGSEWIERPDWYSYVNIYGLIHVDTNSIVSSSNDFQVYTDTVAQRIAKAPAVCDEIGFLTDTQLQELKSAIDTIYSKHGVGAVVLFTSTKDTTWDYLGEYVERSYSQCKFDEHAAVCINIGSWDRKVDRASGWWGHALDDFNPYDNNALSAYFYNEQYAKMVQVYLLDLNKFLGGKDSDLSFSW